MLSSLDVYHQNKCALLPWFRPPIAIGGREECQVLDAINLKSKCIEMNISGGMVRSVTKVWVVVPADIIKL